MHRPLKVRAGRKCGASALGSCCRTFSFARPNSEVLRTTQAAPHMRKLELQCHSSKAGTGTAKSAGCPELVA